MRYFTFLPVEAIAAVEAEDAAREGRPQAQGVLAQEVTRLVHGDAGLLAAQRITEALFNGDPTTLSADDLAQLQLDGLPATDLSGRDLPATLTQVLTEAGMVASGKQVKDALSRGAVMINGQSITAEQNGDPASCFDLSRALHGQYFIVRLGKKEVSLVYSRGVARHTRRGTRCDHI